jgi:ferrous iron transport protein B
VTATAPAPHTTSRSVPAPASATPLVVIVGNPNVGKTTLFNRLTGQNARIGNYPGVTVERRSGRIALPNGQRVEVVDVPGAYSLSSRSAEEQIALEATLGLDENPRPDLCVVVVDAGQLVRNLYLVLQLAELEVPLIVALNMMDEATQNPPSAAAISALFGVPVVVTDGRRGHGVSELTSAIAAALEKRPAPRVKVPYPSELRADMDRVAELLPKAWRSSVERDRALALWTLISVDHDDELEHISSELRECCADIRRKAQGRDLDLEIIGSRYAFIDGEADKLYGRVERHPPKRKRSEQVDKILLHPVLGFLTFLLFMLVVFQTLFSWSDPFISLIEDGVGFAAELTERVMPEGVLRDLVIEGVLGGVGNVIVFLPQILLLFLFIGLLEDSGYMARVAFLMDRVLKSLGLHGRAFVPMLSGFACAVPAILATRTMERQRDRLLTMLVIPLMTCSARLPVYTLIIAALFPPSALFGFLPVQGLLMVGIYVFAVVLTLIVAAVLGRTVVKGRHMPLLLELPPYRVPNLRSIFRMMLERAGVFLKEAGSVILVCTIALWALLSFPRVEPGETTGTIGVVNVAPGLQEKAASDIEAPDESALARERAIEQSYGGQLGKAIEPLIAPLGFDWRLGVGIIGAFAAREVFVSTLGLVYGVGETDDEAVPLREKLRTGSATGKPLYTPLAGLSLLVFFAISCQCMSTLAVVKRETKTYKWPIFMFAYMTVLAYGISFAVYQGGKLLGFG